jgi:hypothetical protein
MGLLDSKQRIMDTIITDEGRRQLGTGRFIPAFYSFSDAGAVYSISDTYVTGTVPDSSIATLLSFEAFPLPQDQVSYEADDSGGLRVFSNNNYFSSSQGVVRVIGGQLVRGWERGTPEILSSSATFASVASTVLGDNTNNFRKLMILKSPDLLYTNRDEFILSTNSASFYINDRTTLAGGVTVGSLEATEDLYFDRRLSHIDNFTFLPPINKSDALSARSQPIGNYAGAVNGNRQILTFEDLKNEFNNVVVANGTTQQRVQLQRTTVRFSETTITNRIVGQMFEMANGKVTKLDVIDFGVFGVRNNSPLLPLFPDAVPVPLNPDLVTATTRIHVYFIGKVLTDSQGHDKFINMFTLVFQ